MRLLLVMLQQRIILACGLRSPRLPNARVHTGTPRNSCDRGCGASALRRSYGTFQVSHCNRIADADSTIPLRPVRPLEPYDELGVDVPLSELSLPRILDGRVYDGLCEHGMNLDVRRHASFIKVRTNNSDTTATVVAVMLGRRYGYLSKRSCRKEGTNLGIVSFGLARAPPIRGLRAFVNITWYESTTSTHPIKDPMG